STRYFGANATMPSVRCQNCGLQVQVPAGGRRLCGCGAWLSGEDVPMAVPIDDEAEAEAEERWPRIDSEVAAIERLNEGYRRIRKELSKSIVGQERVLEELLIAIFSRGHCLLVGVPGLAKTLMIRTLADSLSLSFSRIQFTPDLMPSDITGTEVLQERQVTVGGTRHKLPDPFFVLATQNPIEQEGTYPLPEAQQDRFMFNIYV